MLVLHGLAPDYLDHLEQQVSPVQGRQGQQVENAQVEGNYRHHVQHHDKALLHRLGPVSYTHLTTASIRKKANGCC